MRPQHLKDMMLCRESGTDFLAALTGFTNVVLAGLCPKEVSPFFFGGRLLAMNKKSGGIRPIAVGVTATLGFQMCQYSRRGTHGSPV